MNLFWKVDDALFRVSGVESLCVWREYERKGVGRKGGREVRRK